jgi:hypothetical protein
MFTEHATEFAGKPVVDFVTGQPLVNPQSTAYRLRVDYDDENTAVELLGAMLEDPAVDRLAALVVGAWSGELHANSPAEIVEALVAAAGQLASLTAIFLGDIIYEENEVSWINQTDLSPLWTAFPRLEYLQVRGSQGLSLGKIEHACLKSLTIECGGLPKSLLAQVTAARLPALEHLELFLGTNDYGWDGAIDDLRPLLVNERFPRLRYLGLRDSEIADQVAVLVATSPLLKRISTLDLSLGTLGDEGGRALLASADIRRLKLLDLHHHYLSDEVVAEFAKEFETAPTIVNLEDPQTEEEYGRYVSVGE